MRLIKINETTAQRKWMNKFLRAYHGDHVDTFSYHLYHGDTYLAGYANHRDIGYISLRKLDGAFALASPLGNVLKCAYVEQNRRGNGALKEMIRLAIDGHDVKMIEIERDRFERNRAYYSELGFTEFENKTGETLGFCYSSEFGIALRRARMTASMIVANDNQRRRISFAA